MVSIKPISFLVAAVAIVAALWFSFKPERTELQTSNTAKTAGVNAPLAMDAPTTTSGPSTQGLSPRNDVFEVVIKGGKPVGGPVLLQVHQGEQVTLNIKSDSADEMHLHGYDLHAHITPDQTVSLQFNASHTGHFGLELHKAHTELGALEVYPQ